MGFTDRAGAQLPLPLLRPRPHQQDPPPLLQHLPQAHPPGPLLLIQLLGLQGICSQPWRDRGPQGSLLGSTGLLFFFFFFSPTKNVIKGQEGRPRKHTDCIRLDSELLSGKMANAHRVTLHLSSQNRDQRQPSRWWVESPGLLADSSLYEATVSVRTAGWPGNQGDTGRSPEPVLWGLQLTPGAGTAPSFAF